MEKNAQQLIEDAATNPLEGAAAIERAVGRTEFVVQAEDSPPMRIQEPGKQDRVYATRRPRHEELSQALEVLNRLRRQRELPEAQDVVALCSVFMEESEAVKLVAQESLTTVLKAATTVLQAYLGT